MSTSPGSATTVPSKRAIHSETHDDTQRRLPPRRKKACQTCRIRKVKCDNVRPTCSYCKTTSSECQYTEEEGTAKLTLDLATNILSQQLNAISDSLGDLKSRLPVVKNDGNVQQPNHSLVLEPSKDFLQIPAQRTSADAILTWDIFERRWTSDVLVANLFRAGASENFDVHVGAEVPVNDVFNKEHIPELVDNFLRNVHTKNPILEVEVLLHHARLITIQEQFGWDAHSCLVLLACALGSIAKPFKTGHSSDNPVLMLDEASRDGEKYFRLASWRLGMLHATLPGIQAFFYSGVYMMYTLRPLRAWQFFMQASTLYQLYHKIHHNSALRDNRGQYLKDRARDDLDHRKERLEQCAYWSCFKSESEFRVELPLAMTEIGTYHPPDIDMFPIPPTPYDPTQERIPESPNADHESPEMRQMALRGQVRGLCNEEESWYYYLTEIALRRIGNRIVNTFYRMEPKNWLNVRPLLRLALELDAQVSQWSAHLPPVMQHWQSTDWIRNPNLVSDVADHVSHELSWAIENRLLEVRSWLYQPFLYYLIHNGSALSEASDRVVTSPWLGHGSDHHYNNSSYNGLQRPSGAEKNSLRQLIASGIECNLKILDNRSLQHRHHGLWFDLRSLMCASLQLLMVVKSGHEDWIPGGAEVLWGSQFDTQDRDRVIGGKLGRVLANYQYYSVCCPEMARHKEVLEEVAHHVQDVYLRRSQSCN